MICRSAIAICLTSVWAPFINPKFSICAFASALKVPFANCCCIIIAKDTKKQFPSPGILIRCKLFKRRNASRSVPLYWALLVTVDKRQRTFLRFIRSLALREKDASPLISSRCLLKKLKFDACWITLAISALLRKFTQSSSSLMSQFWSSNKRLSSSLDVSECSSSK